METKPAQDWLLELRVGDRVIVEVPRQTWGDTFASGYVGKVIHRTPTGQLKVEYSALKGRTVQVRFLPDGSEIGASHYRRRYLSPYGALRHQELHHECLQIKIASILSLALQRKTFQHLSYGQCKQLVQILHEYGLDNDKVPVNDAGETYIDSPQGV